MRHLPQNDSTPTSAGGGRDLSARGDPTSIYVHIPYCASKCSYCDFPSLSRPDPPEEEYVRAVEGEIDARKEQFRGACPSLYFGGGTPSLFSPKSIRRLIAAIRSRAELSHDVEITLEVNPENVTPDKIRGYVDAGVNRISLGVQSFRDEVLSALGRGGDVSSVVEAIEALREVSLCNFNLDLIFGLPEEGSRGLDEELDRFLEADPAHISTYCLTVHRDTPMGRRISRGEWVGPAEDAGAQEYEILRRKLKGAGFEHYEISNFARCGARGRHNEHYWKRGPYVGLGAAAVSFLYEKDAPFGLRFENDSDPERYLKQARKGRFPRKEVDRPTRDEALSEALFLGLRRLAGVSAAAIQARFGVDIKERYGAVLEELCEAGLVDFRGDILRLSEKGLFLSDEVFHRLVLQPE